MTNSHTEAWDKVRSLEDVQALLASIDSRRRLIREHAWNEGSWDVVYVEATAMRDEVNALRDRLSASWEDLVGDARGQGA